MADVIFNSADALLSLSDDAFIDAAYMALMGRKADQTGKYFYTQFLEFGGDKIDVIAQIARSKEARDFNANIAGLKKILWISKLNGLPVTPRYFKKRRLLAKRMESSIILARVGESLPEISSVYDILELYDQTFVNAAFESVLGRPADVKGMRHYLFLLRSGVDRRQLLADLSNSKEGREYNASLPGLKAEIRPFNGLRRATTALKSRLNRSKSQATRIAAIENMQHASDVRNEQRFLELRDLVKSQSYERSAFTPPPLGSDFALVRSDFRGLHAQIREKSDFLGLTKDAGGSRLPSGSRLIIYYVDHTINCPANTGMQRLVRQLARGLVEAGENIRFVKWIPEDKRFGLINKAELNHLAAWNGPKLSDGEIARYPDADSVRNDLQDPLETLDCWFLQPEVSHITYHDVPPTVDAILAARALGAKVAAVYYDAIPLRLPSYAAGLDAHEKYMQGLLLADLILPISERSAEELRLFFAQHQRARSLPSIRSVLLPGETNLADRVRAVETPLENIILSVGSMEPRKNHSRLIEAFHLFSQTALGKEWQLVLAGNIHSDVAPFIKAGMKKNPSIKLVPHPTDEELDRLYRSASFTVFPSLEEGFGLPILESLWYGVPCICANFGAMAEVAEGGGTFTINTREVGDIASALKRLAGDSDLREKLRTQATTREIKSWAGYAQEIGACLATASDHAARLNSIYFWISDTATQVFNTGIQRVIRQSARGLMEQGLKLIPVVWDAEAKRMIPANPEALLHCERWNGPRVSDWAEWIEPSNHQAPKWIMVGELVHIYLDDVTTYAREQGLRTATIFYDAIPYKMRSMYNQEWVKNHGKYMEDLIAFDKVFAISASARADLINFFLSTSQKTHSVDHRVVTLPLPCELVGYPRNRKIKKNNSEQINILMVGSIEPRKNQLLLLEAFSRASFICSKELNLTIVGKPMQPWPEMTEMMHTKLETIPNCEWLIDIDDDRLHQLYEGADFTIFPSLEEGFGLPIAESLWNGRPCIVHQTGAVAEIAQGGGCLTIDMKDKQAITDAILEMAENERFRREVAVQSVTRELKTWNQYAREIIEQLSQDRLSDALLIQEGIVQRDVRVELPNLRPRPKLSICISTYNRAGWLGVNLKNIFSQLPNPSEEIEILVVDNTSTDNTSEIVRPYLDRQDFRYLRNLKNVGMLGNLTVTAHEARGDYIWILGDDDLTRADAIDRVLRALKDHPDVALVYPNYAYTYETEPANAQDMEAFLEPCPAIVPAGPDLYAPVKVVACQNENLFTAIYSLILRRDHALRAYSQDTSGRAFSTMRTAIPTTYYVLNYMMEEPAYWIGDPIVVVNFNVSWNAYASLFILERFPEAHDLAERLGSDGEAMDRWREHFLSSLSHYWREIFENDPLNNAAHFSPERVVLRYKHLDGFRKIAPRMREVYDHAYRNLHPAANLPPEVLFATI
ncbi:MULTISPECIES: glycosyltransferase [unclassified Sphingobium]|uniref:glycosyltransferase n=1 Tax=unclassified Sphingobium TaxID=2611147 RepID=UPI00222404DD|nr:MULTISPECIES: glycosyltransferase [unclassified Sphingobium]MCW2349284.1 glycosyltransferase involved in cell wall biosynthesis [Sphingobium sp. B12D2B]MCW2368386.1 glycosyltransferase involved in cell wall biosynthesis [Sphingobium sp. B11D3D]